MIPIICIGNYHIDKKIKEMMKVCEKIELKTPKSDEIEKIITMTMPNLEKCLLINNALEPSISPDGTKIAFVHKGEIYIKKIVKVFEENESD